MLARSHKFVAHDQNQIIQSGGVQHEGKDAADHSGVGCSVCCRGARASEIQMLARFADTLEGHQEGVLAYYDYPISTGPLEGTNTKIQAMKRQAYGFRDREFFKLKILGIHETKHALVG